MAESCCSSPVPQSLDQTQAVEARYGAAALEQEACLCTPVGFDPALLKVIPDAVVERDYGCGDPTRWVKQGDRVLDLGSGSGKNAFICSQICRGIRPRDRCRPQRRHAGLVASSDPGCCFSRGLRQRPFC